MGYPQELEVFGENLPFVGLAPLTRRNCSRVPLCFSGGQMAQGSSQDKPDKDGAYSLGNVHADLPSMVAPLSEGSNSN
jgi:hypothetical protein